jgi:hypothetical protein
MISAGWSRPTSIPARSESQGARINVRRHGAAPMRRIFSRGQNGDFRMSLSPRLMIGFGAGFAWAIRRERHGRPIDGHAARSGADARDRVRRSARPRDGGRRELQRRLGRPRRARSRPSTCTRPYHIAGSDASGIVWAVGSKVKRWKVGDEVVVHCNQDDGDDEECNGGDPMFSPSQRIWGYETPDGSFAQFCRVQAASSCRAPSTSPGKRAPATR